MKLDQVKHKEAIRLYFAADLIRLKTGEVPDLSGLLFLLSTGDVSQKLNIQDQFFAYSVANCLKYELGYTQLKYKDWFDCLDVNFSDFQMNKIHYWINELSEPYEDHSLGINSLSYLKRMRVPKEKKEELIYSLINLHLIRNNQVPILNQPFSRIYSSFECGDTKEIEKLQYETLELLNS